LTADLHIDNTTAIDDIVSGTATPTTNMFIPQTDQETRLTMNATTTKGDFFSSSLSFLTIRTGIL